MRSSKLIGVAVLVLLLVIAGGVLYWLLYWRDYSGIDYYELVAPIVEINAPVEYRRVGREPSDPKTTEFDPEKSDSIFTKVLKGYFHQLDPETQTIQLKNQFQGSSYLQVLAASYQSLVGFYCWPKIIRGQSGEATPTQSMEFFVYPDGRDLQMPGEKFLKLDLLPDFLTPTSYLIIQLREPFNLRSSNYVQKLIILGC